MIDEIMKILREYISWLILVLQNLRQKPPVMCIDRFAYSYSQGYGVHSSNAIMMSAPILLCTSIAYSGVKK